MKHCSLAESDPIGQLSSLDVCHRIGAEKIVSIDRHVYKDKNVSCKTQALK